MGEERADEIVFLLEQTFADRIRRDPGMFRRRFRKMAADPFAFYRGAAPVYYADVARLEDPWADERLSKVWIHGDLHAENFGTYLDSRGLFVFDVNDFDESYLGHYAWDLMRCAASLALIGWRKAFPDEVIDDLVARYVHAYLDQVRFYVSSDADLEWALRLDNATGPVRKTLMVARERRRSNLLDRDTIVVEGRRRFADKAGVRRLEDGERDRVLEAYQRYLEAIPHAKQINPDLAMQVKDVVGRSGFGIGSAGLQAYNVLIEGNSQALENDVVLSIKEGNVAAPSAVVDDPRLAGAFAHHGHRTALSQRALQAYSDPYLGWTDIDGTGYVVAELSPYTADLEWDDLAEADEVAALVADLGATTAKMHCVSDADAEAILVDEQVEVLILERIDGRDDELISWLQAFARGYAESTRDDHAHFVDAFRAGAFRDVAA